MAKAKSDDLTIHVEGGSSPAFMAQWVKMLWESASEKVRKNVADRILLQLPADDDLLAEIRLKVVELVSEELRATARPKLKEALELFESRITALTENASANAQKEFESRVADKLKDFEGYVTQACREGIQNTIMSSNGFLYHWAQGKIEESVERVIRDEVSKRAKELADIRTNGACRASATRV